uniref:Methylthioadenosine phosphorylase n=1 Tax=Canis lupus familiaris TaxID=9615 RepID=A0A8C0Q108_CANLF
MAQGTSRKSQVKVIGIIGGTGLDDPEILEGRTEKYVDTPFGKPSDALILGKIKNVDCVLLARHGRQHSIMPSNVNYQANIWALKEEGCTHVIVTTACGSLREEIQPGDIVIIDQFIDSCVPTCEKWKAGPEKRGIRGVADLESTGQQTGGDGSGSRCFWGCAQSCVSFSDMQGDALANI